MGKSVFIYEPHAASLKRVVGAAKACGYQTLAASTSTDATRLLEDAEVDAVLLAHNDSGIEIAQYIKEFTAIDAPLAVLLSTNDDDPRPALEAMAADAYLRRPAQDGDIDVFLQMATHLREAQRRLLEAERTLDDARTKLQQVERTGGKKTRSGFHHFDSVKDLLVVEVRRAKRYGYPLAILLVGLDPLPAEHELSKPELQREITIGLASAIAKSIRVIDLPIQYADDRILIFLPHTDLPGAEEVGRRIKRRIKRITYRSEGLTVELTASVGLAGISAGDNLTFSKLIRLAASALKAAQLKGGDKVMKRVPTGA
ncbi:MAG: diguanylate cyclase [Myxococcales bacterium]|nr:diguanylate cyclase [Myxococcales bacterium]